MHREIQIKQFPIVTTHWWPKTRNERFVWENEQYLYRFFTSCTQPCPSDLSAHTHPVCDVCVHALWLTLHSHGASASTLDRGRVWSVVLTRRHSYNNQSHTSLVLHERDWVFAWGDLIGWRLRWRLKSCVSTTLQTCPPSSVDADAPCECSVSQSARTHTSHTGCVCTQITWTWLCTRGKKRYKYCSFSHTPLVSCLRPSMCSYDGEWFNLDFSVHVLFPSYRDSDLYLPLYDWQTRTVWPKNIKNGSTEEKKDTYILDALGVSW